MEVKEILKMKEIINILSKIEFCKKNTYNEKTLSFLNSIKEQYKEKDYLSEKQLIALNNIYNNIKEEKDLIYDEMLGFSLDN